MRQVGIPKSLFRRVPAEPTFSRINHFYEMSEMFSEADFNKKVIKNNQDLEASQDEEDSCEHSSLQESEQSRSSSSAHIHGGTMEDFPASQEVIDLVEDISSSGDFNDIVNPAPERFSSVHIRKNLWIPYTGPVVRGKHMMMC